MRATAGAGALPPALQGRKTKRRSDRHKKQERRTKARKVANVAEDDGFRAALWADALEGVDPALQMDEDDDDFDIEDDDEKPNKRRKKAKKTGAGVLPKRFLPRPLAAILVEEANKEGSVAREFLASQALLPPEKRLPVRKFCPVTGVLADYTEPKSGIPYSGLRALEQIRERPPPWLTLSGTSAFEESVSALRSNPP